MFSRIPVLGRLDPFLVGILTTVAVAGLLPASGTALDIFTWAAKMAIGLLFFLYGARLSTREALEGLRHWRLHLTILATTFALFPLLGLATKLLVPTVLTEPLYLGVLYLCLLPSTVQSSIALVSVARGNIAGAVVSASASSLLGIVATPLLVALTMTTQGVTFSASAVLDIVLMLLVPFVAGQLLRRWIGGWVGRHGRPLKIVDRGSILLVVYVAFSRGMNEGIWSSLSLGRLLALTGVCLVLLALVLAITWFGAPRLGFAYEDRATILFCGSTKSLATGLPMATVLFPGQPIGLIVLPLMLFHQIQLLVCAAIAARLAKRAAAPAVAV
ncbi:bile acid:sodium symporter family protein [Rhodococcus indonesiensis]|uniref:Bile acid:sodium symporter family protein n=1 Tax=Rhodococcus indonesiensis TaxID=3055869 RepID=A0ABT7RME9_9NOCA|nr:bile acid:sodium symporter family protein [Rhodococcus indonesiensis]MDM7488459.1 bile acid:sodium symporter family protein [Rhodococcus indonesiensis]